MLFSLILSQQSIISVVYNNWSKCISYIFNIFRLKCVLTVNKTQLLLITFLRFRLHITKSTNTFSDQLKHLLLLVHSVDGYIVDSYSYFGYEWLQTLSFIWVYTRVCIRNDVSNLIAKINWQLFETLLALNLWDFMIKQDCLSLL